MKLSDIDKIEAKLNPELASKLEELKEQEKLFSLPTDIPVVGQRPKQEQRIPDEDIKRFEGEGGFVVIEGADKELSQTSKQKLSMSLRLESKRHPLSQRFHDLLKEAGELHDRKAADYGSKEDPFLNLKSGHEFGIRPWINSMSRANDKMVRIKQYAKSGKLENESVKDSLLDLAVYALISLVLLEEDENQTL